MLVDRLAQLWKISDEDWVTKRGVAMAVHHETVLVKSGDYFMNDSGKILQALGKDGIKQAEIYVVHDDLDLRLGKSKIQYAKGPELHGGLNDIVRVWGRDFWRIRIGVDDRDFEARIPGPDYVLQQFSETELQRVNEVLDTIAKDL